MLTLLPKITIECRFWQCNDSVHTLAQCRSEILLRDPCMRCHNLQAESDFFLYHYKCKLNSETNLVDCCETDLLFGVFSF